MELTGKNSMADKTSDKKTDKKSSGKKSAKTREWFENEQFWIKYGPVMFDKAHWAEANGIARGIIDLANLKKNSTVLDACSGPGRISVELALEGMKVTAVDITQPFLDAAKETAEDEGVKLTLLNQDMRTFKTDRKFDAAINVYNSFGYCDKISDDTKILKSIYSALKEDGCFILECISREIAVQYFTEGEWFERNDVTVLTEFSVEGLWEGLRSHWILLEKDGSRTDHVFVQRLYSAVELKKTLLQIGFRDVKVYGGFDLSKYDQKAKTMLIIAKK